MKWAFVAPIALIIGFGIWQFADHVTNGRPYTINNADQLSSSAARIGIEAGINAILIEGIPQSQAGLDRARVHARTLIEKVYPEVKWQWPPLKTNGIETDGVWAVDTFQ